MTFYDRVLSKELKEELFWLQEEFDLFFSHKAKFSTKDKALATQMIENSVTSNLYVFNQNKSLDSVALVLNNLKMKYPELI